MDSYKSSKLILETAGLLEKNKEQISRDASRAIFESINTYRKGVITQEESARTCETSLGYLISYLKHQIEITQIDKDKLINDIIQFEEGIAVKRLRSDIDLKDLLSAVYIYKNQVWKFIKDYYISHEHNFTFKDFFVLEDRINTFYMLHIIDITDSYVKVQKEFMRSQEAAFKKWETVVKSAHNIELNIPCREAYAAVARMQAESLARRLRFDEEKVQDIKLAVGEACANAIEHGSSRNGVDVHYHITPSNLIVEVKDYGRGFTPPEEGIDLPLDLFSERGRGLYIMKALMDKVDVKSQVGEGTLLVLNKER
ncbi:MAG: ATP-binding protein [Armatimonadota bacterium]